jgi:hypothetical protein
MQIEQSQDRYARAEGDQDVRKHRVMTVVGGDLEPSYGVTSRNP